MPSISTPRSRKPPDSTSSNGRGGTRQRRVEPESETESDTDTDTDTSTESDTDSETSLRSDASTLVEEPVQVTSPRLRQRERDIGRRKREDSSDDEQDRMRVRNGANGRRQMGHSRRDEEQARLDRAAKEREARETEEQEKEKEGKKEKKKGKLTREDYQKLANEKHREDSDRPSGSSCGCGCLHTPIQKWLEFWSWRGWKVFARIMPYVLSLVVVISAGIIGASGLLDYYVLVIPSGNGVDGTDSGDESSGPTYGAWGYCQAQDTDCSSPQPFYSGPTVSYFPGWFMPLLLISMGGLAAIHLALLIIILIYIRYPIQGYCGCVDLEAQTKSSRKWSLPSRKARALRWFDRSMSIMSLAYCLVAALLVWWVSTANADGLWPYGFNAFLLLSPLIWLIIRAIYRSRWAYTGPSRTLTKSTEKGSNSRRMRRKAGNVSQNYEIYAPPGRTVEMRGAKTPARVRRPAS